MTIAQLRRVAVAAQGFGSGENLEAAISRLSAVQLDALAVVERSHRIVLGSRVGAFEHGALSELLGAGRIFEYWAHEACLLPIDAYPLVRPRMSDKTRWASHEVVLRDHPDVVEAVQARLASEGPLPSRAFESGPDAYGRKAASAVLAALWDRGVVAIAGRESGQRLYHLAERVIPREYRDAPPLDEGELLRELALRAVRGRGVLTEAAIREHWRLKGGRSRVQPHLDVLVAAGRLAELEVDDGGAPVYVLPDTELDVDVPNVAVLLSPFDSMLWDRPLTERLFGFQHVIEIYKRAPDRVYGYYVLPFLAGDRIAARADLKTDRKASVLNVLALHVGPGVRWTKKLDAAFDRALAGLARLAGAERAVRPAGAASSK